MSLRASWEEGYAEGYPLGLREGRLLRILASRQLELTPAQRAMLEKADLPTLERWIDLAASITHIDRRQKALSNLDAFIVIVHDTVR